MVEPLRVSMHTSLGVVCFVLVSINLRAFEGLSCVDGRRDHTSAIFREKKKKKKSSKLFILVWDCRDLWYVSIVLCAIL